MANDFYFFFHIIAMICFIVVLVDKVYPFLKKCCKGIWGWGKKTLDVIMNKFSKWYTIKVYITDSENRCIYIDESMLSKPFNFFGLAYNLRHKMTTQHDAILKEGHFEIPIMYLDASETVVVFYYNQQKVKYKSGYLDNIIRHNGEIEIRESQWIELIGGIEKGKTIKEWLDINNIDDNIQEIK